MDTFNEIRWYPNEPYLRFFSPSLRLTLGNLLPDVTAFVLQRTKEWGDPTPFDLTDYSLSFKLYDNNNNLILEDSAEKGVSYIDTGEVIYKWKDLDIQQAGVYYCQFVFTKDNKSISLPNSKNRFHILVIS